MILAWNYAIKQTIHIFKIIILEVFKKSNIKEIEKLVIFLNSRVKIILNAAAVLQWDSFQIEAFLEKTINQVAAI